VPIVPTATLATLAQTQRDEIFTDVWELVRDRYVYTDYRGVDWNTVRAEFAPRVKVAATPEEFYALMEEMIERLGDEHSRFISPRDVEAEQDRFEGDLTYVGIGAIIRTVDDGGLITQVAEGAPAYEAGLRPRDLILEINGTPFIDTTAFGPGGPISAVRGVPNTSVRLLVRSPGQSPREVAVTRRAIPSEAFPSVKAQRLPGTNVGLLTIGTFYRDGLDQAVRQRLEELAQAGPLDGLIVDVRDNGGGRVDLMLNTIGLFVDGGSIGSSIGRDRSDELTVPSGKTIPQFANVPIVVLTSPDTVSAAEMFSAGMQTLNRARIVGVNSAGNTENLLPHTLPDGSRLWLAELTFRLPDGSQIEGRGVQPDRGVDVEWWRYEPDADPQIQAAIEELRGKEREQGTGNREQGRG
jgi:C-terminal peptidase prc